MAGKRRQLGAGRIIRDHGMPVHAMPTARSRDDAAAAIWRILDEGGHTRAVTKACCAARPDGSPQAPLGSVTAAPSTAKPANVPSASPRSAGPLATANFGPAMGRGKIDPHLVRLLDAWATLPIRVREAIVAMIDAARQNRSSMHVPPKA